MDPNRNVLFVNRVYPPAPGATGELLKELGDALVAKGWVVNVVAGPASAGDCAAEASPIAGNNSTVQVERVRGLPFTRASHWKRALGYCSLYPAIFWRAARIAAGKGGTIVTLTDPPLLLVLGPALKWIKKARLVHWAQDIYPEVAEELGVVRKGGLLAGFLRRFSTWALRRHDVIIVVGRCMKQRLVQRGIDPEKIVFIPNWAQDATAGFVKRNLSIDAEENSSSQSLRFASMNPDAASNTSLSPRPSGGMGGLWPGEGEIHGQAFRKQHGFSDRFVVAYSGNFGLAHPFDAIVGAVADLEKRAPQILFVFIGNGPRLSWLKETLQDRSNVRFLPFQPKEMLAESLAAADLHLASMSENLWGLVVPSKIYGILAAGRPCIFVGPKESEAARILLEHDCGTIVACSDRSRLASEVLEYSSNAERLRSAGRNTRRASRTGGFASAIDSFKTILNYPLKTPGNDTKNMGA